MEQTLTSSKQLPHPISWNVGQKTSEIKTRPKVSGFDGVHFWWALSSKRKHCVRFSSGINSCESLVRPPNTDKNWWHQNPPKMQNEKNSTIQNTHRLTITLKKCTLSWTECFLPVKYFTSFKWNHDYATFRRSHDDVIVTTTHDHANLFPSFWHGQQ